MTQAPGAGPSGDVVSEFAERFAAVLVEAGFPPMAGRVFSALLTADSGQFTAAELSAALHASPAAISGAVRYLAQLGLVGRERERGSRRDRYRVRDDVWYEVALRRDQVLRHWVAAAAEGVTLLGPGTPAGRRFAESAEFFAFLQREMPQVLARWREHQRKLRELPDGQRPAWGDGE
jgi:DNA-binding transcriptional ArsR family regulator